ncbi:hypothetical protein TrRE_jg10254 [Triparma retinervis]|uniref:PABS domain-containing protein n=1 Tax=Triparma retinervis TaxID=2557542 RepID=A0A9W6ZXY4_9STRA|nr:hypothetical protein TrRE_jg10254 [Triparma retinervis]
MADTTTHHHTVTPPPSTPSTPATPPISSSSLSNGWFTESSLLWPGQRFSLSLDGHSASSILHQSTTPYQSILIFRSSHYGLVLCLDGVIQVTERDEFAYAECMSHVPMAASAANNGSARRVLIIGGGDGCVLREVLKHREVEEVVLVEIDEEIIRVAKAYLTGLHKGAFDDPRVRIINQDAFLFLMSPTSPAGTFDVIINDTSDPCGPSAQLYSPDFFRSMYSHLNPGGCVCSQVESCWLNRTLAADMVAASASVYDAVEYGMIQIPSYPTGGIGFVVGAKETEEGEVWDIL